MHRFYFSYGPNIWCHSCLLVCLMTPTHKRVLKCATDISERTWYAADCLTERLISVWEITISKQSHGCRKLMKFNIRRSVNVRHALTYIYAHVNHKSQNGASSSFLRLVRSVLQVSFQRHVWEPVQRDLTRALQGEGNKTQRDEANILILLS